MHYEIRPDEPVSTAVVRTASAVTGCEPCSLPPLIDVVDPDALNALFAARNDGTPRSGKNLSFIYSECRISIDNGEFLSIELLDSRK